MQQSSIRYKNIKVMTKLPYTQHDSLKISYKKANVLRTSSSRRRHVQLSDAAVA